MITGEELPSDRRQALRYLLGLMAAVAVDPPSADALMAQAHAAHQRSQGKTAASPGEKHKYRPLAEGNPAFFNASEFRSLTRMVDLIIPRTNTPGAADAGVPLYIDIVAGADEALGRRFRKGLADLDAASRHAAGKNFVDAAATSQAKILQAMLSKNAPGNDFFETVKAMTVVGYYSSEIGLYEELHFVGNQALSTFPGCPHGGHSLDLPARRAPRAAADPARIWPFPNSDNITGEDQ